MRRPPHIAKALAALLAFSITTPRILAEGAPTPIGNFGPTGIEISILPNHTLSVLNVQPGSPAESKLGKGDVITLINNKAPVHEVEDATDVFGKFKQLASFITHAEASNGLLRLKVKPAGKAAARDVEIRIPVLGSYSASWPLNCEKTRKIIRANADYIASVAGKTGEGLTAHNLESGFAILMLLSTGEKQDLDGVRKVYKTRMASFDTSRVDSHNWHNGIQGMAVCEYYLRTGDASVMPLINAICESARKYQVYGGWSHWAKGINPQYTAGGHMNAAGTQVLTTLLLAKQCGANVNEDTLTSAVRYFYRFAGHGTTPYGDHRPEQGYGGNNGKTEMVALAMSAAARAENGDVYAMARDKNALSALYNYPYILNGHTGGNGAKWHGIAAALMAEKKPALYRTQLEHTRWFFELSRRHTGAMGACGTGRYDQEGYGYATGLALTAPLKALQITGAPKSPYAKPFTLETRPWGREADLAFFNTDGGPAYQGSKVPPHVELARIVDADEATLRSTAGHPEQAYRERTADTIREKGLYSLIEELLESKDPLARQTACKALNCFEPWRLRFAIGTRSQRSIDPAHFTPRMFKALMSIITDPKQAIWSVDQALAALAVASPGLVKSRLDDILPWLDHPEWMLNEAASIALTPAMKDSEAMDKILPPLANAIAGNVHAKGRGVMGWMLQMGTIGAPEEVVQKVQKARVEIFEKFISVPDPEPGVDLSGITSVGLESAIGGILRDEKWQIRDDPEAILKAARLAVSRMDELRSRERDRIIDMLLSADEKLEGADRKQLGQILLKHFRPAVVGDDPEELNRQMEAGGSLGQLNKLLAIDRMAGRAGGWQLLGNTAAGKQAWWHTSYEPNEKPHDSEYNRYRQVKLPASLADWYQSDYDPAKGGWTHEEALTIDGVTPKSFAVSKEWFAHYLPKAGEAIFIRKSFELDDLDYKLMRLTVYCRQGYEVYLNGHRIVESKGRSKTWGSRQQYFNDKMEQHLKKGTNVIAVRSFLQYFRGLDGGVDVYVERLDEFPPTQLVP